MSKIRWKSKEQVAQEIEEGRLASEKLLNAKKLAEEVPARVDTLELDSTYSMIAIAESYEQMYNENMMLLLSVAESYEQSYLEDTSLMVAVAELYEEVQSIKGGTV